MKLSSRPISISNPLTAREIVASTLDLQNQWAAQNARYNVTVSWLISDRECLSQSYCTYDPDIDVLDAQGNTVRKLIIKHLCDSGLMTAEMAISLKFDIARHSGVRMIVNDALVDQPS